MARSLKVSQGCIEKVKLAVRRNGFPSQRALAEDVGLYLATVNNFLTVDTPRSLDAGILHSTTQLAEPDRSQEQ
ncbi:hypothetical protein [Moorena sp. SIO3H5]|uniref:hypothetical protein n=1 Tax=Moorena sp. SIO3H5 TaxID=2607834 RepID=UPI0013BAA4E0|nr:hypothetical protein [Moorena sp. SIO3H5]NEO74557.1 hypothetical protein [Moorena sp. SIO3H5]